ncbi:MAG: hypothetical protein KAR06_06500 [Deltaproteobacteria bacterium]|nr:hypothetical protein [Deltaproteobacteria bacterium]
MEKHIELAQLREEIRALQQAVESIKAHGIRESLLMIAIQRSAGMVGHPAKLIPMGHVKGVLEGIEYLEGYMFPEEETEQP